MKPLTHLFEKNRKWADGISQSDPTFFAELAKGQSPEALWIGCSDSRVPPSVITGLPPGQLFVHRNIANLVVHSDMNLLSVLQYAVDALKIQHIIVCGHYDCGGIKAALDGHPHGLVDNWLRYIHDVYKRNDMELSGIEDKQARLNRLIELNVVEQVNNIRKSPIVKEAWKRGQDLTIHGWIYRISNGLLEDLDVSVSVDSSF
jgi:carbonic anhydrase